MIQALKNFFQIGKDCLAESWSYFLKSFRLNESKAAFRSVIRLIHILLHNFYLSIRCFKDQLCENSIRIENLENRSKGLHQLLPLKNQFNYSILFHLKSITSPRLERSLKALLRLSAPQYEIRVAVCSSLHPQIKKILEKYPVTVKLVPEEFSTPHAINSLSEDASGNYLLILQEGDIVRPDLLYRYEQFLTRSAERENLVIYCKSYHVNRLDDAILGKESCLEPPFLFKDFLTKPLVPKKVWEGLNGFDCQYSHAFYYDFALRLNLKGYTIKFLPHNLIQELHFPKALNHSEEMARSLQSYAAAKNLAWRCLPSSPYHTCRAIPEIKMAPSIHIVVLFKDFKEITLKCIESVLSQKNVRCCITAVDNRSADRSIAEILKAKDIEVLEISEPFNFSRLNNLAVERSQAGHSCDYILFLNNDVILDPDALEEMARWIEQPSIGMVGCLLNYPNGMLQHGGIDISNSYFAWLKMWRHYECQKPVHKLDHALTLSVCDAVTGACALIKKEVFNEVGGFDEVLFPITYSDTSLAAKIKLHNLHCFYTPFAKGIHYESLSRKNSCVEDIEFSSWFHKESLKFYQKETL